MAKIYLIHGILVLIGDLILIRCFLIAANSSGIIINTCGWVRSGGYQCLTHAAGAFEGKEISWYYS